MQDNQHTPSRITDRDRRILEHVDRHRVTQHAALRSALFPDLHETATVKVISRLCRDGLLQRVPLLHRQCYFTLTPHAARLLGVSEKRTGPLGVQSLPCELAALHFVCRSESRRTRLTAVELARNYPWMKRAWFRAAHCVEHGTAVGDRLELLRVALGGKPDHVARKCFIDVDRRREVRGFQALIAEQRFRLVVIVPTKEGADAVRHALQNHQWPDRFPIQLTVLSQLLPLLGGLPHAT